MHDSDSNSIPEHDNDDNATDTEQSPTHQDFHWINGAGRYEPHASFIENTLDISAGIHACLQIVYASDLERAANSDADPGDTAPPAIGIVQSDQLMRLSIASAGLLRGEARRLVEMLNT